MKVWSWRQVIEEADLKPTTKLILYTLSNYMNSHGKGCYPTISTLEKSTGVKERALYNHLKAAEEAGFLIRKKRNLKGVKWASNEYEASYPQGVHVDAGVHAGAGQGCTQVQVKGCTQVHTNSPTINSPMNSPLKSNKKENENWEEFWKIYDYKVSKKKSKESYFKTIKAGVDHEEIINGVRRYQEACRRNGTEQKFIKHAVTWLNGSHWEDEYPDPKTCPEPPQKKSRHQRAKEALGLA